MKKTFNIMTCKIISYNKLKISIYGVSIDMMMK